jgi:hypothetical protein
VRDQRRGSWLPTRGTVRCASSARATSQRLSL